MSVAMKAHDRLLRQYMALHTGYEVKQNGDGFTIAFQHSVDALKFCLAVQAALPSRLAAGSVGDKSDGGGAPEKQRAVSLRKVEKCADRRFRDIKLRMALHHGEVFEQGNPVTKRADYMGPLVNRAARYIQATEPEWIVVSEPFLETLKVEWRREEEDDDRDAAAGESFEIRSLGEKQFKGVEGLERLFIVLPSDLKHCTSQTDGSLPGENIVGRGSVGGELQLKEWTS